MPYVLMNRSSHYLLTCHLVNHYDMTYYGTAYWDDKETAEQEKNSFLASRQIENSEQWEIIEVTDHLLKLCNVKLKNDADFRIKLEEGRLQAVKIPTAE